MLGPDLTDKIVALMAKFREEPVKKMADIESPFQQVLAAEKKQKSSELSIVRKWQM